MARQYLIDIKGEAGGGKGWEGTPWVRRGPEPQCTFTRKNKYCIGPTVTGPMCGYSVSFLVARCLLVASPTSWCCVAHTDQLPAISMALSKANSIESWLLHAKFGEPCRN